MQPLIWLGILALLLVVEAITAGLTTIWFAGGALVAAIACYAGANPHCTDIAVSVCFHWYFSSLPDHWQ